MYKLGFHKTSENKARNRRSFLLAAILAMILFPLLFTGCSSSAESASGQNNAYSPEFQEFSELNGKRVSMLTGAPFDELVRSKAPDVGEFTFFNSNPDMVLALKTGKTDAFLSNNAVATLAANRNSDLILFPQSLDEGVFGIAFAKGNPERDKWQKAYEAISEEKKNELWEKWTGSDDSLKTLPPQDWPGKNGTVKAAVCDTLEPMSYMKDDGELVGFDVEMILTMARELDVHVEFTGMEFSAILSSVQSGKADMGAGSIIATDERKEAVDFLEYYPASFELVVRAVGLKEAGEKTLADMETARIAVLTGSNFPEIIEEHLPNAERLYFNSAADCLGALLSDKADAMALDEPVARNMEAENSAVYMIPESIDAFEYAFIMPKNEQGEALKKEFDAYLLELKENGELEKLEDKWFEAKDLSAVEMLDYTTLPGTRGTINVAAFQYPPFDLTERIPYSGYEVEILAMFARDRGYALVITGLNADSLLSSVQVGKFDIGCGGLTITEERKESLLFSEPCFAGGMVLLTLKEEAVKERGTFFDGVKESFEKTFLREDRWKLFAQGILTTLLITVFSILFGTLLGFAAFMLGKDGNPIANAITKLLVWLIQGMPAVVLLMILYYIVFARASISGTIVSVIGFSLVFGSSVYSMIKAGVRAVDKGQMEAAYALGYTSNQAFFKVILPQALPHFMPNYIGEITSLIKATAIVGYVAVQDLTKMADIIRSRTYDAFFPLIAVAVIYFILAGFLRFIVKRIDGIMDPRKRTPEEIMKGLEYND